VESFAPAVDALSARSLPGVTTVCSDLHRADALAAMEPVLREARLLVLDPPREGLRQTDQLLERAPALQAIVYISCDVATFARDAALAQERGFALQSVQPLDLFPQTPHVELLGLLRRRT
jgi:23S rRNA (uracil1939-C5)-methyltransferase